MNKILIIAGPTATGKTALGIRIAKRFHGEIISADSRQVYRGMDIGTGKDLPENPKFEIRNSKQIQNSCLAGRQAKFKTQNPKIGYYQINEVRFWLYDMVEPDYRFSVADYIEAAELVIKDIWTRGKLPIIVGGTGFYIKAVIDGIATLGVPPDWELRRRLENEDIKILGERLKKLDPERWGRMNEADRDNPRRLIRAIEIATQRKNENRKKPCLSAGGENDKVKMENFDALSVGLTASLQEIYRKIDQRVKERVKQGVENEIKNLLDEGYSWENSALGTTMGYKEWREYFEGKISEDKERLGRMREEIIERWKFNEHSYARRQMTWFKKDKRIRWFDISKIGCFEEIVDLIKGWYNTN